MENFNFKNVQLVALGLGGALFLVFILFKWPVAGIAIFMVLSPFVTASDSISPTKALSALMLFGFMAIWVAAKTKWRRKKEVEKDYLGCESALLIFFLYLVFNSTMALINGIPLLDIYRDLIPIQNLFLFFVIKRFVTDEKKMIVLEKIQFAILLLLTAEYAIMMATNWWGFYNIVPAKIGALYVLGLFLIGSIGILYFRTSRKILIVSIVISAIYLIMTPTRTHFLAAIMCFCLAMLITGITQKKVVYLLGSISVFIVLFLAAEKFVPVAMEHKLQKLNETLNTQKDLSLQDRKLEAEQCFTIFKAHPIFGIGAGYTYHLFREYIYGWQVHDYLITNFTHSDIMYILSKLGIVGFVLFMFFYVKITLLAWRIWKSAPDNTVRAKGMICFIVFLCALIIGQSTPVLQTRIDAFFLSLVMGYTYCLYRFYVAAPSGLPAPASHGTGPITLPRRLKTRTIGKQISVV